MSDLSPAEIVRAGLCIGCGVCADRTSIRMGFDRYGNLRPEGAGVKNATPEFARTCPFSPKAVDEDTLAAELFAEAPNRSHEVGLFRAAWVGHVVEGDFRERGSSGGMASWVLRELLARGLVDGVFHVKPCEPSGGRFFRYELSEDADGISGGAKSRYYPVEMSGVLAEIRKRPGRYAVVGVPCFIKALRLACREDPALAEKLLFTLGLFCGHMKSARMLESFAWQMGCTSGEVSRFDFRIKDPSRPASTYTAAARTHAGEELRRDWWNMPDGDWGAGFFQNPACNCCDDVLAETADISFGDAWVEPYSSDGRGTNVVVARSEPLARLVSEAIAAGKLELRPVDAAFVAATQAAGLRHRREGLSYRLSWRGPAVRPRKRIVPKQTGIPLRRKCVYRIRAHIGAWSHPVFSVARLLRWRGLYIAWARTLASVYGGCTYLRGPWARLFRWMDRNS